MENLDIKKSDFKGNESVKDKSEKDKYRQLSFRVTKEKLKFIRCYLIDNERTINDFFNEMIDRLMANEERKSQKQRQNVNGVAEKLIAGGQQIQ